MDTGIGLGVSSGGVSVEAAIRALFASGEQGAWFDPSDFSTMFQDSAGTTPVTATGQPVGLIRDKSGRGNHASQGTAASRPTLQQDASGFYYLSFDGTDDGLATGNVDFTATDKLTVVAGVFKASDAAQGAVAEHGTVGGDNLAASLLNAPFGAAVAGYGATVRNGGLSSTVQIINAAYTAPVGNVVTTSLNNGGGTIGAQVAMRANGVLPAQTTGGTGPIAATNFGNLPLFIGRRGGTTIPLNGRIYSLVVRGAASTAAQITQTERFVGYKMGIAI